MGGTSPHDLVFATTMLEGHGLSAAQIRQLFSHGRLTKSVTRRAGQTVGTHTWSHKDLARNPYASDLEKAKQEIEMGNSAVHMAAAGAPVAPFFRFPDLQHTAQSQLEPS